MKKIFSIVIVAVAAVSLFAGCQKYDDSELRKEIQELKDKISELHFLEKSAGTSSH